MSKYDVLVILSKKLFKGSNIMFFGHWGQKAGLGVKIDVIWSFRPKLAKEYSPTWTKMSEASMVQVISEKGKKKLSKNDVLASNLKTFFIKENHRSVYQEWPHNRIDIWKYYLIYIICAQISNFSANICFQRIWQKLLKVVILCNK